MKIRNISATRTAVGLAVLLVILKLTGTITWGWIWVLSPIWICLFLAFVFTIIYSILGRRPVKKKLDN